MHNYSDEKPNPFNKVLEKYVKSLNPKPLATTLPPPLVATKQPYITTKPAQPKTTHKWLYVIEYMLPNNLLDGIDSLYCKECGTNVGEVAWEAVQMFLNDGYLVRVWTNNRTLILPLSNKKEFLDIERKAKNGKTKSRAATQQPT
jgi:hypothetical protein